MKKITSTICYFILFAFITIGTFSGTAVLAENDGDYLFSSKSNNTWVLKKTTRKLILVSFEKADKIWKSKVATIPDEFNLDECIITAVGIRGTSVFLFDQSSSLITLFSAKDEGSIVTFLTDNLKEELK